MVEMAEYIADKPLFVVNGFFDALLQFLKVSMNPWLLTLKHKESLDLLVTDLPNIICSQLMYILN